MNNWMPCVSCNKYFPKCIPEHHITGKCNKCLGRIQYREEPFHASTEERTKQ